MKSAARVSLAAALLLGLAPIGCATGTPGLHGTAVRARVAEAPRPATKPVSPTAPAPPVDATAPLAQDPAPAVLALPLDRDARELPAGRSVVEVAIPEGRLVSIGIFGPVEALLDFDVVGPAAAQLLDAHAPLDEDGRLPLVTSFAALAGLASIRVLVDASEPVTIARAAADPDSTAPDARAMRLGTAAPRPLVGLPAPFARSDGYLLQSPGRYQFVRIDVARALAAALRQTRVRFRRDPIAVGDITQWNGVRPATDLGHPRHISHEGGRDVDLALPSTDEGPSTLRPHCTGVLVTPDTYVCAPGTGRGVDALRLAYLLGLLVDGIGDEPAGDPARPIKIEPRIEKIFTDDAFIREIRAASEKLRARRWIKEAGYAALSEDGILRASPWHVDHVHVRFTGQAGRSPWGVVPAAQAAENE